MQNISLVHRFILEIQQILQSLNLKDHTHLFHQHPKIIKVTFGFPESLSTHQKPVYSIDSFLRQPILVSLDWSDHTHF